MAFTRKLATVFGGSGFIGRYVVKRLATRGYVVRVAVRDVEAAMFLRPMGDVGQIVPLYAPLHEPAAVARAVEGADAVINLVGILNERRKGDFEAVHIAGAERIARLAASAGTRYFVQLSALGTDLDSPSRYASSKAAGEQAVRAAFPRATVLRPSITFGAEDRFFNRFAAMATLLPILPITGAAAKFQPVHVGDVADAVLASLSEDCTGAIFELGGPEVKTFRELLELMLKIIERRCFILDLPRGLAMFQAGILQHLPGKLLTQDQIKLLQRDNVTAIAALDLSSLGIVPTRMDLILPSYLARYRPAGRRREDAYRE